MSHLQQVLAEIEAKAARESAMAMAGAATIDAAYALRDRLINEEEFDPIVTLHYHGDALEITIHAMTDQDDMFRVVLAGLGIEAQESAGYQKIFEGVSVMFKEPAQWFQLKAAA